MAVWENLLDVTVVGFWRSGRKDERSGFGPNCVFLSVTNFDTSSIRKHKYVSVKYFYLLLASGKTGCRNMSKTLLAISECHQASHVYSTHPSQ